MPAPRDAGGVQRRTRCNLTAPTGAKMASDATRPNNRIRIWSPHSTCRRHDGPRRALSLIALGEQEKRELAAPAGSVSAPLQNRVRERALGHCTALGVSDSPEYISYRRREGCGPRSSPAKSLPSALGIDQHSDAEPTVAGLLWLNWSGTPRLSPNDRPSTTSKVKLFKLGGTGVTFHVNAAWKWPRRRLIPFTRAPNSFFAKQLSRS